jgi:hypothetical protein
MFRERMRKGQQLTDEVRKLEYRLSHVKAAPFPRQRYTKEKSRLGAVLRRLFR